MSSSQLPSIPSTVAAALGALPGMLAAAGYVATEVNTSKSFGDFAVTYLGPRGNIQLARDRGQFIVSGPTREELESFGLWRTFSGARDLELPLQAWLRAANEA